MWTRANDGCVLKIRFKMLFIEREWPLAVAFMIYPGRISRLGTCRCFYGEFGFFSQRDDCRRRYGVAAMQSAQPS